MIEEDLDRLPPSISRPLVYSSVTLLAFLSVTGVWAVVSEFSTTIRVSGTLSSQAPSAQVQHPNGGKVRLVAVDLLDRVNKGDVLFRLDVEDQTLKLSAVDQTIRRLEQERGEARARLGLDIRLAEPDAGNREVENSSITASFAAREETYLSRQEDLAAQSEHARSRLDFQTAEIKRLDEQKSLLKDRLEKFMRLSAQGLTKISNVESLMQEALSLEIQIGKADAEMAAIENEIISLSLRSNLIEQEYRQILSDGLMANERELESLNADRARLLYTIETAEIKAPVSGLVSALNIDAEETVAAPGQTLAVISQPLVTAELDLKIMTQYIDQVSVGQEGLLTLSSLPQRNAPKIRIELTGIAEEPIVDPEGNPVAYLASASVNSDDLETARQQMADQFQISLGMPISATLVGRPTTLWSYLTAPFTSILDSAFED